MNSIEFLACQRDDKRSRWGERFWPPCHQCGNQKFDWDLSLQNYQMASQTRSAIH